ncbi:MAG: globin [Hyphomonadaceae bacterium]
MRDAQPITDSLALAAERGGDLTAAVYARLFRERPELEPLFVLDTDGAVRGEMLARTFDVILDLAGARSYAPTFVAAEATTHEGYAVPREAYARFFAIVAETVRDACGADWTEAMQAAWADLLSDVEARVGG